MKKFFKSLFVVLTMALVMPILSCSSDTAGDPILLGSNNSSWYMHYFYAEYGLNCAMIRSPENSNVAILSTTEQGKGGDLHNGSFVQLTKTASGNSYTFKGSKNGTIYEVRGQLSKVSNGTTNDSFTIEYSSEAMESLGFSAGKSIQHWTELNKGDFIY